MLGHMIALVAFFLLWAGLAGVVFFLKAFMEIRRDDE